MAAKKTKKSVSKKKKAKKKEVEETLIETVAETIVEKQLPDTLVLEEKLSIATVNTLKQTLSDLYTHESDITIDTSAVCSADTSAIQLLLAFSEGIAKQSRKILWLNNSESFLESSRELGLDKYFQFDDSSETTDDEEDLCPVF